MSKPRRFAVGWSFQPARGLAIAYQVLGDTGQLFSLDIKLQIVKPSIQR
jgi:hypothetical protein